MGEELIVKREQLPLIQQIMFVQFIAYIFSSHFKPGNCTDDPITPDSFSLVRCEIVLKWPNKR